MTGATAVCQDVPHLGVPPCCAARQHAALLQHHSPVLQFWAMPARGEETHLLDLVQGM